MKKFQTRECLRCHKKFDPKQWNHVYCGSKREKTGCSWERERERAKKRSETSEFREYQRKYGKEWKKKQRQTDSDYAKRQREAKSRYAQSPTGKLKQKEWRRKNKHVIRANNRKRRLRKMEVFGSHSHEEWENLKRRFDYKCAGCGVSEDDLLIQYPDAQFGKLTRDHVIPTSKGGTDFIANIQPLCISCNAKKRDNFDLAGDKRRWATIMNLKGFHHIRERLGKIVCTSLPADPLHPGHISCLRESAKYGDSLVVVVNGDWFLHYKKGRPFMSLEMRSQIVAGIRCVDVVVPFEIEGDLTVCQALKVIRPHVFTKGGDRCDPKTIPEWEVCEDYGIEVITDVGDSKIHSSSNLLEDWYEHRLRLFMV